MFLGDPHQRLGVLGETGAPITGTGVQEFAADAVVEPHAASHGMDIGAHRLA